MNNMNMIHGLKINDQWYFCDPESRFRGSNPTNKDIFQRCLEDFLCEIEGECSLPRENEPWTFWRGASEEVLKEGKGELIVTLHSGNKDALWDLKTWVVGPCVVLRIKTDY